MSHPLPLLIAHLGLVTTLIGGEVLRRSDVLYGRHPDLLLATNVPIGHARLCPIFPTHAHHLLGFRRDLVRSR